METSFNTLTSRNSLLTSYVWLVVGLLISAVTSTILYATNLLLYALYYFPYLAIILVIAQFGIAIGFTASMRRASATTLKVLYIAYALTLGVSLTSLGYVYDIGTIGVALAVTSMLYVCLIIIGMTTKRNLASIGTIAFAGLIALIISQLILAILALVFLHVYSLLLVY